MEEPGVRQATYMLIYERTEERKVVQVSSSVRRALFCEPYDIVGYALPHFIPDIGYASAVNRHVNPYTNGNTILALFNLETAEEVLVHMRTLTIACSNVYVGMVTVHTPNPAANAEGSSTEEEDSSSSKEDEDRSSITDLGLVYSMRGGCQACIVLGSVDDNVLGPTILYSTESISLILNAAPQNISDRPFLKLVVVADILKASLFLERALSSTISGEPCFEKLNLVANPQVESQLGNPRSVAVEFMAMRSDSGILLLCQLDLSATSQGEGTGSRYLPLQRIVASDPGSTSFPRQWRAI